MKVAFPHMGNTYIAMKAMFDDLGIKNIVPPKINKRTLEIGTKLSPEQICIPFKYNIGNYIEAIENGADTIIMIGGIGSCRLGYFGSLSRQILKDLGYNVEFIVLDYSEEKVFDLIRNLKKMMGTKSWLTVFKSVLTILQVLRMVNKFEKLLLTIRPHENIKGHCDKIYRYMIKSISDAHGSKQIKSILKKAIKDVEGASTKKNENCLKIGIVGEIYILIDDCANLNIAKKLNDLGAEVSKSLNTSEWIENLLFYKSIGLNKENYLYKKAAGYINNEIGGHGRETIGSTIHYAQQGYDGVIQVLPLTCMPEIIAMSMLPKVQEDYNIPVMTVIVDEMTGEAGYITRLEAFTDLLKKRKEKMKNEEYIFGC